MAEIFLEYGASADGQLVHISQVSRGRSTLTCPYCGISLLAKKGEKLAAHFAHNGETCAAASRDRDTIALPAFDRFNLDVPARAVQELHAWVKDRHDPNVDEYYLEKQGLLKESDYKANWYELTTKANLVLGKLSLDLFNRFQEPLIVQRHADLSERAHLAAGAPARIARMAGIDQQIEAYYALPSGEEKRSQYSMIGGLQQERYALTRQDNDLDFQTALTDLKLYRTQWRRILACTLYFLEVTHAGGRLHKIGVTTRPIAERLTGIAADLAPVFGAVQLRVVDTWPHRGNVEMYFKYRYASYRAAVSNLTEYFTFEKVSDVTRDLRRMQPKDDLTDLERQILTDDRTPIERDIDNRAIEQRRRAAIRQGLRRATGKGQSIGRPRRTAPETPQEVLRRDYATVVLQTVEKNPAMSLRALAGHTGLSVNTIRKVLAAIDAVQKENANSVTTDAQG